MKALCSLLLFFICFSVFAQKSDSTYTYYRLIRGLSQHITELKTKRGVRNGLTEVVSFSKPIASGIYKDDVKVGRWRFFKEKDTLEQIYNYTTKKLEYNLIDPRITYQIDSLKDADKVILPAKIGGVHYALHYLLRHYPKPYELRGKTGSFNLIHIFSLNEKGILIHFETKIASSNYNYTETVEIAKLKPEDLEFTPAIKNGVPIKSILIFTTPVTF